MFRNKLSILFLNKLWKELVELHTHIVAGMRKQEVSRNTPAYKIPHLISKLSKRMHILLHCNVLVQKKPQIHNSMRNPIKRHNTNSTNS